MNEPPTTVREIDRENRNHEVEKRFNLHINRPYRICEGYVIYDGILTSVTINDCGDVFQLLGLTLEEGIFFNVTSEEKKYLEQKKILPHHFVREIEYTKIGGFARIMDEEGFIKVRDRVKERDEILEEKL